MTLRLAFRHAPALRCEWSGQDFDIAFAAPTPGVTCLYGPSGAGKSTTAAVAAGLLRPQAGRVEIDGTVLADSATGLFVPPQRRRIGLVSQQPSLFPHLSVAGNLRYGLNRASDRRIQWAEVIDLLGLSPLLSRRPATLSGGEQQRVAIGRALLSQPRLLILDEPLAALDPARRAEIMPYLARLTVTLALPVLYITHDQTELARLARTVVLIDAGRVTASGPLADLAAHAGLPMALLPGAGAVLDCMVLAHLPDRALTRLAVSGAPGLDLLIPPLALPPGRSLRVRVPAADVILAVQAPSGISVQNILPARVERLAEAPGASTLVELRLGAAPFLARITADGARRLALAPGKDVLVLVKSVAVQVLG